MSLDVMETLALWVVLAMLTGLLPLCVEAGETDIVDGAQLYGRYCASCHGPQGHGDGPVANAIKAEMPDLTRLSARAGGKFSEERIRRVIDGRSIFNAHGTRTMPVWGYEFWVQEGADEDAEREVEKKINALVEYLRSIQFR